MKNLAAIKLCLVVGFVLITTGCTGFQPISNYARTGDTVTLAIGGTHESNAQAPILKKENIAVQITDSLSNTYPVKLRYLFRTYPDYSSTYAYNTKAASQDFVEQTHLLMGQWMAVIDLVDPVTGEKPLLNEGPATIHVTSADLQDYANSSSNPAFSYDWNNGNLQEISIEILPGTGSSHLLNYLQPLGYDPMLRLEPLQQIEISPVVGASGSFPGIIGGAEFVFTINHADFGDGIKVVPAVHDPVVNLNFKQIDNGDNTSTLKVLVMNPNGFKPANVRDTYPGDYLLKQGGSIFRSLGFSLVWDKGTVDDINWANSIQLDNHKYIDINGDDISASYVTYSMNKVN